MNIYYVYHILLLYLHLSFFHYIYMVVLLMCSFHLPGLVQKGTGDPVRIPHETEREMNTDYTLQ